MSFPATFDLDGTNGLRIDGAYRGAGSGTSVANAGDVNGDGIGDVIIGAPAGSGTAYVVYGSVEGFESRLDLSGLDPKSGFRIDGVNLYDHLGASVGSAGNVNGDGFDDLIIGAPQSYSNALHAGATYIVFGPDTRAESRVDLMTVDPKSHFRLDGEAVWDLSGSAVSGIGDFNGDGCDDFVVGASSARPFGRSYGGATYVVFGKEGASAPVINLASLDGDNGFRVVGPEFSLSGYLISAGDVNSDGFADLITSGTAASHVIYGGAGGFSATIDLTKLGSSVGVRLEDASGAGDINGDGYVDLIFSAPVAGEGGRLQAGQVYVLFGQPTGISPDIDLESLNGSDGFRIEGVDRFDWLGTSVSVAGDVDGDGFGDLIIGAGQASPMGRQFAGSSFVVFGRASGFPATLDLTYLDGETGLRIDGVAKNHRAATVSAAGDLMPMNSMTSSSARPRPAHMPAGWPGRATSSTATRASLMRKRTTPRRRLAPTPSSSTSSPTTPGHSRAGRRSPPAPTTARRSSPDATPSSMSAITDSSARTASPTRHPSRLAERPWRPCGSWSTRRR